MDKNQELNSEQKQYPKYSYARKNMSKMESGQEKIERIPLWLGTVMIIVALGIDGLQALLTYFIIGISVNWLIAIGADTAFTIWFWTRDVQFVRSPKILAVWGGQALIGLIPGLNALPELTLAVLSIVIITRAEDKGGIIGSVANIAQGKISNNG